MGRDGRQLRIEPCSFIRVGFSYLFFLVGVVGIKKGVYLWGQTNTHTMIDGRTITARLKSLGFTSVKSSSTSVRGFRNFSKGDFSCVSSQNKDLFSDVNYYERVFNVTIFSRSQEIIDAISAMDDIDVKLKTSGYIYFISK